MTKTPFPPALLVLLSLAGCANSPTPDYDLRFGDAVRAARAQQTLNPDAGAAAMAAPGMDGRAAREALVRYQDSFKQPPPVINVINIGGATGSAR